MSEIEFKRKAYDAMLTWKSQLAPKYALLIEGARRVGKTHLIERFVKNEYESFIFIDFSKKNALVRASMKAFTEELNIQGTLERLQILHGVKLVPGKSCVVFDEVQRFPTAREAIKELVGDGQYHFIESGSLLGIRENVKDIVIPSEEHKLKLYPLDYEEFLWAIGEELLSDCINKGFAAKKALPDDLHAKACKLARQYMVVGGMPQAVEAFLSGGDRRLEAVEAVKREILSLYDEDIGKYARGYAPKVREIFRRIPASLNTSEKKFHLAALSPNARMRRYENAFLWLADAMVANIAYNSTTPDVGLGMNLDSSLFKCYSLDVGLLVTQAMTGDAEVDSRLLRGILYDKLNVNEGMFFENLVVQTLVSRGHEALFYSRSVPKVEVDFLFRNGIKICPVEVKSATYRAHASLDWLIGQYAPKLGPRYVICTANYEEEDGIVYLPVYMTHCL